MLNIATPRPADTSPLHCFTALYVTEQRRYHAILALLRYALPMHFNAAYSHAITEQIFAPLYFAKTPQYVAICAMP